MGIMKAISHSSQEQRSIITVWYKTKFGSQIWLATLVTICNGVPKLVAQISSHIHHLVNTGLAVGSLVKWLPIKVATPANQTQF